MKNDFRHFAKEAARAASDRKAQEISVLDLRGQSDVADYVVVLTVDSSTLMSAVENSIEARLKEFGLRPLHREGKSQGRWMALDYGGLLVHILLPQAREFYRLDSLWENPKQVSWEEAPELKVKAKTKIPARGKTKKT